MSKPEILFIAGSARRESVNKKLARAAAAIATDAGAHARFIDLADYPLPLYDGDMEDTEGLPANASELKKILKGAHAVFLAAPEYNSSITPLLKNFIDWTSRPESEEEPMLAAWSGKIAAISSASPGGLGGMRGLVHLRDILGNIGVFVIPQERSVRGAFDAFDEADELKEREQEALAEVVKSLIQTTQRLTD